MKKRYVAKIFVLVVALVMLVSILVACGEQNAPALQSAQYDSQGNLIVTLTDGTVLDPIDVNSLHTYGEWRAFGDFYPTCEEKVFYRSCAQCGDVEFKLGSYDDHDFVIETTKATCQVEGKEQRKCTICGKEEEKVLPKVDHEWESVYQFDTTYHWKKCINCTATTTKVEHVVDESGYCTICNGILGDTVGVIYDLSTDGTYAEVIGYEGSAKRVIIASEYNGKPVKSIYSEAFMELAITSVVIPDSVTSIGDEAFFDCSSLSSVTIGNSVTSIGDNAFWGCDSLTSITIPDSVTSIGGMAFAYCYSLSSVTIGNSVTSIGNGVFDYCNEALYTTENSLKYVKVNGNPYYLLIETTNANLSTYNINAQTKYIGYMAFYGCQRLSSITIPDSVTSIGSSAFNACPSLTSVNYLGTIEQWCGITFGDYSANPLYYINELYLYGELVEDLVIPSTVTEIKDYAFYNCDSITSVTIPDSVTSIGYDAFYSCYSLSSVNYLGTIEQWCNITFGNPTANPLYYGAQLYLNGELVEDIVIPNTVTEIKAYAFYDCDSITSVTIPDSVTSIGEDTFSSCYSLSSVNYLGTIEQWCGITFDGSYANPLCYGAKLYLNGELVEDLVIPSTVTEIKDYAFRGCDSITSVTIPDSVTSIGDEAFYNCNNLSKVYYNGTEEEWSGISIGSSNYDLNYATRYYYSETEPVEEGNYWHYVGGIPTPW